MTKKNQRRKSALLSALLCLALLAGCGVLKTEESPTPPQQTEEPVETSRPTSTPSPAPTPTPVPQGSLTVPDRETVKGELQAAMEELRQPRAMDLDPGLELSELDVKNLYYEITRERPDLKYTYDLAAAVQEGQLTCGLSFMPYKTGAFPADFGGEEADSLQKLLALAENHLGEESVPVRITDPTLEPDKMNRALQQVGGGYLYCALNADATAIQYTPPADMTLADCLEALALADSLADQVVEELITDGMTQREKAQALYAYLTVNVEYDPQYTADRAHMPYESQTAVGALRDRTAICGGYANALKLLYEKVGIPCYTISGKYFQENHMWNIARLEGEWLWFDATIDRGSTGEFGFLRFALAELDTMKYHYEEGDVEALTVP